MTDLGEANQRGPLLDVPSTDRLGQWPRATAQRAKLHRTCETLADTRKTSLFFADDERFEAVAGRPLKNVAGDAEQGSPAFVKPASKPDLPLAAAGRTAQHSREEELQSALAFWFIRVRLTFDMSGMARQAKPAVACPLDRSVRPMDVGDGPACRVEPDFRNAD